MQKYIDQLLAQMKEAETRFPTNPLDVADSKATLDRSRDGRYQVRRKLEDWFGLSQDDFPPRERLNIKQMLKFNKAFESLLLAFGLVRDFPDNLPFHEKYRLYVYSLANKTAVYHFVVKTCDFCSRDVKTCPLGVYCSCSNKPKATGMQAYIDQLADEMEEVMTPSIVYELMHEEPLSEADILRGKKYEQKSLSQITGLTKSQFPRPDKLTDKQMGQINKMFFEMWKFIGLTPLTASAEEIIRNEFKNDNRNDYELYRNFLDIPVDLPRGKRGTVFFMKDYYKKFHEYDRFFDEPF